VTTERRRIEVRGVPIEVVRKEIRNLHIGVYPPAGRVRVAAPRRLTDDAIRLAVVTRLGWIRRQQAGMAKQVRQSERELVSGESHYFGGQRYRLRVIEQGGPPSVSLSNNTTMTLRIRPRAGRDARDAVLQRWYRAQLRTKLPTLVAKWEPRVGVAVEELRIRNMKTRWGSANAAAGRIWLNLELVKKPAACLEYVLVHEMVHLLERHHNERFRQLMDSAMQSWRLRRDELNRAPLAHEEWRY
jgi:hypothetical protein